MNLADALSGRAGLKGVRWLLLGAEPREVLRHELSALLSAPGMLGASHLRHAKFRVKPDVKLSAYFDVSIRARGSGGQTRAIAVMWKPKWRAEKVAAGWATPDVAQMEVEALRCGLAAPFRRLTARVPGWRMYIQVSPLDPCFPQLVRASDPEHVQNMLAIAKTSNGGAPGRRLASHYAVTSIKYQPGQRHVLRYDSAEAGGETIFAKLYKGEEGSRISTVVTQVADWLASHQEGVACLRPLGQAPDEAVVLYPLLTGTPLHQSLRRPGRRTWRHLELAGQALSVLHQAPQVAELPGPRSFEAEITEVEHKCDFVPLLLPSAGAAIESLIGRARDLYERLPQEPPTFTHGDFKAEHFWVNPRGLTLMDFDASGLADPALDVGRFLADLALWYAIWQQPGLKQGQESFLAGYAPGASRERLVRARLYEALELVRCTGRRLSLFDRDWAGRVRRLLGCAAALLDDLSAGGMTLRMRPSAGTRLSKRRPIGKPLRRRGSL